jgi:Mg2+ and Co2+ transporter CorA
MIVQQIRDEIEILEQEIADHLQADQFIDGKRFGNSRLDGIRQSLSFARARLIAEAGWAELISDTERQQWIARQMPQAWPYLSARLQLADDAEQIPALRRRTISAETQLAGAKAQINLFVAAAERALAGDNEALLREIKEAKR